MPPCSGVFLRHDAGPSVYADQKQSAEAFTEIAALVQEEPEQPSAPPEDGTDATTEAAPAMTAYEKYAAVYEQNSDFVGWISIDGTNINYPVMQSTETDYYLKRAFDKSHSAYGTPYVQENCILGSSDNCIIYGHHMKDGSMFADLCRYESEIFTVSIRSSALIRWRITASMRLWLCSRPWFIPRMVFKYYHFVDAENEAEFDGFIAQCKALALYDTGVSAEYGDQLITFSTCEYSRTNGRMVVVAKWIAPSLGRWMAMPEIKHGCCQRHD